LRRPGLVLVDTSQETSGDHLKAGFSFFVFS